MRENTSNQMQHIANFLSARDLCSFAATCVRARVIEWSRIIRERFPHCECIGFNPHEFLLLLEDRARNKQAAIHLTVDSADAVMMQTNRAKMLRIDAKSCLLRGDVIIDSAVMDALRCGNQYIFDGIRAFDMTYRCIERCFPMSIRFGREFSVSYYDSVLTRSHGWHMFIDADISHYTTARMMPEYPKEPANILFFLDIDIVSGHLLADSSSNICELIAGSEHYFVRSPNCATIEEIFAKLATHPARLSHRGRDYYAFMIE